MTLERLEPYPEDAILALIGRFRADPRPGKLDLGVGVYRDASGRTPVMRAVKAAERAVWQAQESKAYTAITGDPAFTGALARLVLGEPPADRMAATASVGGTGAIRVALELARLATPGLTVWLPEPTWPNHATMVAAMGLPARRFRYYDPASGGIDISGLLEDLGATTAGDVVVLHACCHNPTGADPAPDDWRAIAGTLAHTGAVPLVDLAYHGFGEGLERDAAGTRLIAEQLPEVMIAASCSKSFGLYRDRAGALLVLSEPAARDRVQAALAHIGRHACSFPPDHGARVVQTILDTPALCDDWQAELTAMRARIAAVRTQLAQELRRRTNSDRHDALMRQRGMFSRLPAAPAQVAALRDRHGVYAVGDGRINLAGLDAAEVPVLAAAIADVGI